MNKQKHEYLLDLHFVFQAKRNFIRWIYQHKQKVVEGFSKKYDITRLVHAELFDDINEALHREKCIKKWNRSWKLKLIEENNPDWKDLCDEMF